MRGPDSPACCDELQGRFGERLSFNNDLRQQHGNNVSFLPTEAPEAVLFAQNKQDVIDAVKICARHRFPVIAWGAGTSVEGQLNAPHGGLSIDLSAMNEIIEVSAGDMTVTVQPGITREFLNSELRATGLFFPVDPGGNASIGGMAATRASGTTAVRYGTMKDLVLSAEVVLADGSVVRTASHAKKSSAGYDLTRLMVGSEGTLGIMTELTIKVFGIPEEIAAGICRFETISDACQAVMSAIQYGVTFARVELVDELQIRASNLYSGLKLPEAPTLFVEFSGSRSAVREQSELFGDVAGEHGSSGFEWSVDADARAHLWKARHNAYYAALGLRKGCGVFSTDVCVPISRLAECVEATQADLKHFGLLAPIIGHVGDGNFHVLLTVDPEDAEERGRIDEFVARLVSRAIEMQGTCTGEHGIGQRKGKYLRQELGESVALMKGIKSVFDPLNILNPGKYGF